MRIGVISDTHGLLRPEAIAGLRGVSHILHAGDIGSPEILDALRSLAPVTAVRGNNDRGSWAAALPANARCEWEGVTVVVVHDIAELNAPAKGWPPATVVVSGHSHKASERWEGGTLFFNPGSAGPRRFRLPVSLGRLTLQSGRIEPEVVQLVV